MKILSVFRLCYVGALLLALFVAWTDATPQLITGEYLSGGCCSGVNSNTACGNTKPDKPCTRTWAKCTGYDEKLRCTNIRQSACNGSLLCVNHYDQECSEP